MNVLARSAPFLRAPPVQAYFAFGGNMNPARVQARGLTSTRLCGAALQDYALVFDKVAGDHDQAGHANIRFARGEQVYGVLYELIDSQQIERMDPFERTPINYSREVFTVRAASGEDLAAWTYVANSALLRADLLPTVGYMNHLLAGAAFLPPAYCEVLRQWPCLPKTS